MLKSKESFCFVLSSIFKQNLSRLYISLFSYRFSFQNNTSIVKMHLKAIFSMALNLNSITMILC